MVAGNVDNFPKRLTKSSRMECNAAVGNDRQSVTFDGKIVIQEADEVAGTEETSTGFSFALESQDEHRLSFNATAEDAHSADLGTNYMSMTYHSDHDEEIYGMGLQYSEWNFKGKQVPLISTEAGVGRGLQPLTAFMNKFEHG